MLAASQEKMSGSEKKVKKNMYNISSTKQCNQEVSGHFHVVVMQNNSKEMYKKIVLQVPSCFFAN